MDPPTDRSTIPGFNYPTPTSILSEGYWNDDYTQANVEWEHAGNDGNWKNLLGRHNIGWRWMVSWNFSPMWTSSIHLWLRVWLQPYGQEVGEAEDKITTVTNTPKQQTPRNNSQLQVCKEKCSQRQYSIWKTIQPTCQRIEQLHQSRNSNTDNDWYDIEVMTIQETWQPGNEEFEIRGFLVIIHNYKVKPKQDEKR